MEKNKDKQLDKMEILKGPKTIDIFNHLKLGIKNSNKNCSCDHAKGGDENEYYCIPCKISCCPTCSLSTHSKHLLAKKQKFNINKNNIEIMFEPIDYVLENNSLFTDSTLEKNQLLKEVESAYNKLLEVIKEWKDFKEKEIISLFETLHKQIEDINNKKKEMKKSLQEFIKANEVFLNTKKTNKNYNKDISNEWSIRAKETSKSIEKNIFDYETNEKNKNEVIIQKVKYLFHQKIMTK